jgi:hypothetical protein
MSFGARLDGEGTLERVMERKPNLTYSATSCISRTGPTLKRLIVCIIQV